MRGNAARDAPRHTAGRGASREAFPRGAWERSSGGVRTRCAHHPSARCSTTGCNPRPRLLR
ncbi:DUF1534 domain-containing protein [Pseudomonas sp. AN3A02]|nr:DUF1534 domain-containing protein [Pseudomonas sp. AN3A02]